MGLSDEPEELTREVNEAAKATKHYAGAYRQARQRLTQAVQARGYLKGGSGNSAPRKGNPAAAGAARRPGETIKDVKKRTTCSACGQLG